MKNAINGLINRLDTLRKDSLRLNIDQKKYPKMKYSDREE